jgi:XTP/dITP diphosphohydrolase
MSIDHLLIATRNAGKVREFRQIIADAIPVSDLSSFPDAPEVDETGDTFRENASIKARAYALHARRWTLADDSGLAVDALGGKPGVHSARWAEMHERGTGDRDNNTLLLDQLRDVPDDRRSAHFVCHLVLCDPSGTPVLDCTDRADGLILRSPRGSGGFGYDPLFLIPALGRTTAELDAHQKHALSHRGKAMRLMASLLREQRLVG